MTRRTRGFGEWERWKRRPLLCRLGAHNLIGGKWAPRKLCLDCPYYKERRR